MFPKRPTIHNPRIPNRRIPNKRIPNRRIPNKRIPNRRIACPRFRYASAPATCNPSRNQYFTAIHPIESILYQGTPPLNPFI